MNNTGMIMKSDVATIKSEVFLQDCMIGMKQFPDKHFELAIVDPPYGIGKTWKKNKDNKFYNHKSSYNNDVAPGPEYFAEVFRVSKHQIIWGANYYTRFLEERSSWIVWDKDRKYEDCNMPEGELAWTSFSAPFRIVKLLWKGFLTCEPRSGIHPHEKPTELYRWTIKNYAKPGDKILDTHMGSQSSRIAAYDMGFDYTGFELDPDYFEAGCKRFEQYKSQLKLF